MAIYFQNTLVRTSDFVTISDKYSSVHSVWRANKRGTLKLIQVGKMPFVPTTVEQVSKLYSVNNWQGLQTVTPEQLPPALDSLSRISKAVGVGEAVILEWALFNRLDAYWVGGTFFANLIQAKQVTTVSIKR